MQDALGENAQPPKVNGNRRKLSTSNAWLCKVSMAVQGMHGLQFFSNFVHPCRYTRSVGAESSGLTFLLLAFSRSPRTFSLPGKSLLAYL